MPYWSLPLNVVVFAMPPFHLFSDLLMYFYASLVFALFRECYGICFDLSWFGRHTRRVDGYLKFSIHAKMLRNVIIRYLEISMQLTQIWNTKLPLCSDWIAEYPFLPALVKLAALTVRLSLGYLCPSSSFLALIAIVFCISVRYATNDHKENIITMYLTINIFSIECISNYLLVIGCLTY